MAAPQVAGLASLAWSYRPDISVTDIKNAIMNNGDSIASLSGKTVSGKRINAYKTLLALTPSPDITTLHTYTDTGRTNEVLDGGGVATGSIYAEWSPPAISPATMSGYIVQVSSGGTVVASTGTTATGVTFALPDGNGHYVLSVMAQRVDSVTGAVATRSFGVYEYPPSAPTNIALNGNQPIMASTNQTSILLRGSGSVADSGSTVLYTLSSSGTTLSGTGTLGGYGYFYIGGINTSSLSDGTITVSVAFRDPLGQTSTSGSTSILKDSIAPRGTLMFLSGAYTNSNTTTLRLTTTKDATYILSGASIPTSTGVVLRSGPTDLSLTFNGGDALENVSAVYTDSAGNTSPALSTSIAYDTTAPVVSINPVNPTLTGAMSTYAFSGYISDLSLSGILVNGISAGLSTNAWQAMVPIVP